jgi:hypothetical protein
MKFTEVEYKGRVKTKLVVEQRRHPGDFWDWRCWVEEDSAGGSRYSDIAWTKWGAIRKARRAIKKALKNL